MEDGRINAELLVGVTTLALIPWHLFERKPNHPSLGLDGFS
jgi:hypothetical protein